MVVQNQGGAQILMQAQRGVAIQVRGPTPNQQQRMEEFMQWRAMNRGDQQ